MIGDVRNVTVGLNARARRVQSVQKAGRSASTIGAHGSRVRRALERDKKDRT